MEHNMKNPELLPRGITSFGDWIKNPEPEVSPVDFKRLVYALAAENRMEVSNVDVSVTGKNFYWAEFRKNGNSFCLLENMQHPFVAFVERVAFGSLPFLDKPNAFRLPEVYGITWLNSHILNQSWRGHIGALDQAELDQIRFWKPKTVGDVIFNFWD